MLRVGLTGGLACGKSFVGRTLKDLGCHLISADDLGHDVLQPGGDAFEPVVAEFGNGILDEAGAIDRRKLASLVFDHPERLKRLNEMVHPAVIRREEELIKQAEAADPGGIVVMEAAILVETGSYKRFEKLIVVVCTEDQQVARSVHRDGCTEEEARNRLKRQMPVEQKRKFADFIVDTSGAKEDTILQTRRVYEELRSLQK